MSRISLLEELRRREVLKTAGLYAGGAWLLTQILLAVLDRSPLEETTRALAGCILVSAFIGGFPIAVLLAWFFDLTRTGVARERPTARGHLALSLAAMIVVVIGTGTVLWKFSPCTFGKVLGIAVLPCSYYGEQGFEQQGPGVARELNYRLSHLTELRVPAWSSTVAVSAGTANPAKLVEILGVERLVECSVRRAQERLTINLQLYDPRDDRNLWSKDYEGQTADELLLIADVFRGLIGADAIKVGTHARGRVERVNRPPTASAEAWSTYQLACNSEDAGAYELALDSYRKATLLDSRFARAHAGAARMHWQATLRDALPAGMGRARLHAAWTHAQLALRAEPDLADALALRRVLLAVGAEDTAPGKDPPSRLTTDPDELHERVLALRPSFAEEYLWWSQWLARQGRQTEADEALTAARALDPAGTLEHRYESKERPTG